MGRVKSESEAGLEVLHSGVLSSLCLGPAGGCGPAQVRMQRHLVGQRSTSNWSGSLNLETRHLQCPGCATFERDWSREELLV